MRISNDILSRRIKEESNGQLKLKDIQKTLKILESVTKNELEKGNTVQIRSIVKLTPNLSPETKKYDGINKRYYTEKEKTKVSVRALKTLTSLNKKDSL